MNINSLYCYYSIHIPPVTLSEKRDKIPHKGVTKWVPFPLYPYPSKAENRPFSKIMSHFEICMSLIMRIIIFRCDVTLILNFLTRATLTLFSHSNIEMQILYISSVFFYQIILIYQSDIVSLQLIAIRYNIKCFISHEND